MSSASSMIKVAGLKKRDVVSLRAQAKSVGLTAERYAKRLIEEGLSLEHQARTTSFDQMFAPVQGRFEKTGASEQELDALVDRARSRHHRRLSRKSG